MKISGKRLKDIRDEIREESKYRVIIDPHANAQHVYGSMMKTGLGMKQKRAYKSAVA